MGSLDVETLRADTPGCESVVHLNNAGSALPPACVVDRVISHIQAEATFGGYEAQADAAEELEGVGNGLRPDRCRSTGYVRGHFRSPSGAG